MPARRVLLLGLIAVSVFGAATLLFRDSERPSDRVTLEEVSRVETPNAPVTGINAVSSGKRQEDLIEFEQPSSELVRERERVALSEELETMPSATRWPLTDSRRSTGIFDAEALDASGFSPKDIDWFSERWEQAETEKRYLADLEARGEEPPPGRGYSDIERELREDLRDDGYDAMLYATHQNNRVAIVGVRDDSLASRAGIRDGSIVWSYDGQRVFRPKELANLSTMGRRGEAVEIVIVTRDGTEQLLVERNPLGAELVSAIAEPHPN